MQLLAALLFRLVIEDLTYFDAVYLSVQTATTVGYGDMSIPTESDKILMSVVMLFEVTLLAELFSTFQLIIAARAELAAEYTQQCMLLDDAFAERLFTHRRSMERYTTHTATPDDEEVELNEAEFVIAMLMETGTVKASYVSFLFRNFRRLDVNKDGTISRKDLFARRRSIDRETVWKSSSVSNPSMARRASSIARRSC